MLARMAGTEIVRIGTPNGICLEGGGFIIDYRHRDDEVFRVVFEFNELGRWTVWEGLIPSEGIGAELQSAKREENAQARK